MKAIDAKEITNTAKKELRKELEKTFNDLMTYVYANIRKCATDGDSFFTFEWNKCGVVKDVKDYKKSFMLYDMLAEKLYNEGFKISSVDDMVFVRWQD